MSWLRNLFSLNSRGKVNQPPDIDADIEAVFRKFLSYFRICIKEIEDTLRLAGLPAPEPKGKFSLSKVPSSNGKFNFEFPCYVIPPHFIYIANPANCFEPSLRRLKEQKDLSGSSFLVITGNGSTIEEVNKVFNEQGIIEVVKNFPHKWVNQEPYYSYRNLCTTHPQILLRITDDDNELRRKADQLTTTKLDYTGTPRKKVRVELVPGYDLEDFRQRTRRILFCLQMSRQSPFRNLTDTAGAASLFGGENGSTDPDKNHRRKELQHKSLLLDLPLPDPGFGTDHTTFKIIPGETAARAQICQEFLESLRIITQPIAFEFCDDSSSAWLQFTCGRADLPLVERQIGQYFPNAEIIPDFTAAFSDKPLQSLFVRPVRHYQENRTLSDFTLDPLAQFSSILKGIETSEEVAFQVLFNPLPTKVINKLCKAMSAGTNGMALEEEDHIQAIEKKIPGWQVAVSVLSSNQEIMQSIRNSFLRQFTTLKVKWKAVPKITTLGERNFADWTLFSTPELATLVHLPTSPLHLDRFEKTARKSKLPPALFTTGEVHIGTSEARGKKVSVTLPDGVRARHLYVVGKSGSGKSTLITNLARQDIERGDGVCVIDPHGDLVSSLLDFIPEQRVKDSIYFNVADREHPLGIDMLNARTEGEIEILTDDLITTFRRLTETWGERMETILRYAFNTLLRTPDATFLDLPKLLTNEGYRSSLVRKIDFAPITDFWFNQYANMPKDAAQPILSRMTKIVLSPTLNAIFGQSENTLNFNDVIRNRKILLVNLGGDSRDRNSEQLSVSDEMKKLIGSVIVSQLQMAAMRQASLPEEERVPCRFFVDEFQNFVSGAFPKILSEARKYKLCLTVAHQYISQLDEATRNAVFGNVGTMIVMPLGQKDARYLGAELGDYTPEDVANLAAERHEALCRPTTKAADTFLFTTAPPAPISQSLAHRVIAHTRSEYSAKGKKVTDEIKSGQSEAAKALIVEEIDVRAKRPMLATEKTFASVSEKIFHFVTLAGYLTTSQIIDLCYSHLSEASRRPAASRDLKKLIEAKKLKSVSWGDGKVFYVTHQCNPTTHNVAVRDLLLKIVRSGFEVAEVSTSLTLGALSPDLSVTFLCEDGTLLPSYWEYDTGTEGITEIIKKVARYVPYRDSARVSFVCSTRERVNSLMKATDAGFIDFAVLSEMSSLVEPAFISRSRESVYSYFSN